MLVARREETQHTDQVDVSRVILSFLSPYTIKMEIFSGL